jgi:hypothetical protein
MIAKEMKSGYLYLLADGAVVVFSRISATGMVIVHPPGEPDMQSSMALHQDTVLEEIPGSMGWIPPKVS